MSEYYYHDREISPRESNDAPSKFSATSENWESLREILRLEDLREEREIIHTDSIDVGPRPGAIGELLRGEPGGIIAAQSDGIPSGVDTLRTGLPPDAQTPTIQPHPPTTPSAQPNDRDIRDVLADLIKDVKNDLAQYETGKKYPPEFVALIERKRAEYLEGFSTETDKSREQLALLFDKEDVRGILNLRREELSDEKQMYVDILKKADLLAIHGRTYNITSDFPKDRSQLAALVQESIFPNLLTEQLLSSQARSALEDATTGLTVLSDKLQHVKSDTTVARDTIRRGHEKIGELYDTLNFLAVHKIDVPYEQQEGSDRPLSIISSVGATISGKGRERNRSEDLRGPVQSL